MAAIDTMGAAGDYVAMTPARCDVVRDIMRHGEDVFVFARRDALSVSYRIGDVHINEDVARDGTITRTSMIRS